MLIEKSGNFVLLTFAQSLDGFIAKKKGQMLVLSSQESLVLTHSLRNQFDGKAQKDYFYSLRNSCGNFNSSCG
jgi:hypothetical protein